LRFEENICALRNKGRVSSAWRAPLVRLNLSEEKNGERIDAVHKVRPTLWSVSLFLAVPPFIVETARIVRCSLLHSLWRFLRFPIATRFPDPIASLPPGPFRK
jgi:hypothetical protein